VIEMMKIELLKYPSSVGKLNDMEILKFYTNMKVLFEGKDLSDQK
jgi:hypothetical protein